MLKKKYFHVALVIGALVTGACCSLAFAAWSHGAQPLVIAHRGASGYLPEHTLAAKALAVGLGADYLEQDLVLSKDGVPVVLHDIHLDTVTDVAERFPGRHREDGRYYALDFNVAEIKELKVTERIQLKLGKAVFSSRFPAGRTAFEVPTLEEELVMIAGLNSTLDKTIGIYPEVKNPWWHRQQGHDLSRAVLEVLAKFNYRTKSDNCWLQCFEFEELKRLRSELGWKGRLVQLLSRGGTNVDGTNYAYLQTIQGLAELAEHVDAIGPELSCILRGTSPDDRLITSLVDDARRHGLAVHAYTVRADALPRAVRSLDDLHDLLFRQARVDGVFTDFPDKTVGYLQRLASSQPADEASP
jgi:glycerophosphoryl diester phosphodiesterase